MGKILNYSIKFIIILFFINFSFYKVQAQEIDSVIQQLEILQKDLKTLEKAIYSKDVALDNTSSNLSTSENDVLTKHLLKLSELEEQFKLLTNNFEEINFKLDKLSNRITKIQKDNQVRFQDLETSSVASIDDNSKKKEKKLPGSGEAQDLGQALEISVEESDTAAAEQIQQTQSIESVGTVVTESA